MDFGSLIGGLGIGSVATLFLKEYFENKRAISKRCFEERRGAYINYLNTVTKSQLIDAAEGLWARTAAIERINLCGSNNVISLLKIVSNAEPGTVPDTIAELLTAMRNDLFPESKK